MTIGEEYRDEDRPVAVEIGEGMLRVTLSDGRVIATPLVWYPALRDAAPEQLENVILLMDGVHWPDVDEYLSVDGMLNGIRPPYHPRRQSVA